MFCVLSLIAKARNHLLSHQAVQWAPVSHRTVSAFNLQFSLFLSQSAINVTGRYVAPVQPPVTKESVLLTVGMETYHEIKDILIFIIHFSLLPSLRF